MGFFGNLFKSEFEKWVERASHEELSDAYEEERQDWIKNPISANANNKNIGADIEGRLNRYKNIEGFTSVWVWAEKISDTQYELYIGYA